MNYIFAKRIMAYLLLVAMLFWMASMVGCYSAKKADKDVSKAIVFYPVETAKKLNDWKPCIPLVTVKDSSAYKKYMQDLEDMANYYASLKPDTVNTTDTVMEVWADTTKIKYYKKQWEAEIKQNKYLNSYISDLTKLCGDKPPIHDTVKIEDSRKVLIIADQLNNTIDQNAKMQKRLDVKEKWLWWLAILLVLMVGWQAIRLTTKYKLPI